MRVYQTIYCYISSEVRRPSIYSIPTERESSRRRNRLPRSSTECSISEDPQTGGLEDTRLSTCLEIRNGNLVPGMENGHTHISSAAESKV